MPRSDFKFSYAKRVRYAEIDAQAVLFNSRYLEYLDIGITEYWRAVGMYDMAGVSGGPDFHVAKALVEYKAPILLDEVVDICVRCARVGNSSMTFLFEIHGAGKDDLRAAGEEISVHMAKLGGRPAPVPDTIVAMFEAYEGQTLQLEKAA
jgi:acyl-CoA thioester hydrolase